MKLADTAHTSRPWRIHEIAPDFHLEDVWAMATPGERGDFARLVHQFAVGDETDTPSVLARALFAIRWKLGKVLGWDEPGGRTPTLRDRLPDDLHSGPSGPEFTGAPFTSLYLTGDEWAAELANRTVHAVLHMGWVGSETGGYRGQLAVLVKPQGLIGKTYMPAIAPLRRLIVFPSLVRGIEREWAANSGATATEQANDRK